MQPVCKTMKKNNSMKTTSFMIAFASLTISFTACQRERGAALEEIETTFELSEDQAITDNLNQDAGDLLEEAAAKNNLLGGDGTCNVPTNMNWTGNCAIITVTGNFPSKTIKIDFGTGCTSPSGVTRKGVINIVLTDSVRKPGSIATTTFDNYYVNGFKKEGTIIRTNTTAVNSGTRSFNRTVNNGKITSPAGRVWTHSSNVTITQIAGVSTPCDLTDDVYTLAGTRTATNTKGKTRTSTTQTPLQKKMNCANIDQGILNVQGTNHTAVIDFGNGTCDNLATISIDGRPTRTIRLR
jgi:hypothetical protein